MVMSEGEPHAAGVIRMRDSRPRPAISCAAGKYWDGFARGMASRGMGGRNGSVFGSRDRTGCCESEAVSKAPRAARESRQRVIAPREQTAIPKWLKISLKEI